VNTYKAKIVIKTLEVPISDLETHQILYTVPVDVPIRIEEDGTELLTEEGSSLIQKTQIRHLGLLSPDEIKLLRKRFGKTQEEMSKLIGCGAKSYTRWETGHSRPTRIVNNLLRLLWSSKITPRDLKAVQAPRVYNQTLTSRFELRRAEKGPVFTSWQFVQSSASTVTLDEQKLHNSVAYRNICKKDEFTTSA
jgi:DNA-binding transcriptional regulator YiaG